MNRKRVRIGCVVAGLLLLGSLAGCGGSNSTTPPPPSPPPPTIGQIYVTKGTGAAVARFKAGDNGDVPPQEEMTQLVPPRVNSLCIDPSHNRLAGTSFDGTPIVAVIDNANNTTGGSARQISGTATALFTPGSCALDGTADLLYVRDVGTGALAGASVILVFGPASSASGNIAPLHTIVLPTRHPTSPSMPPTTVSLLVIAATAR